MKSWGDLLEQFRLVDSEYTESIRVISEKLDNFEAGKSNDLPTQDDIERSKKALKARMSIEQEMSDGNYDLQ